MKDEIASQFECSVYDLLSRHGFLEGDLLIPEEEPLVEQACEYLANTLGIVENRWKPEVVCGHYVIFLDLITNQAIGFYDMSEIDRRKICGAIKQKNLDWISVPIQVNDDFSEKK